MIDCWIPFNKLPEYTGKSRTWCQRLMRYTKGLKIKVTNPHKKKATRLVLKSSLDSANWQTTP